MDTYDLFVLGSCVAACSAKVGRFPQPGEALIAESFTLEAGGKGLNLAVGAHRLGATVDGLIAIGDDVFGQMMESALAGAGLPASMIRRHPGKTGAGIGFTDPTGETCVAVFSGANLALSASDVASSTGRIATARAVLAQFEIADAPILAAFEAAHDAGVPTILNPSPFRPPPPELLAWTSTLVVNAVEAAALFLALMGEEPADDAVAAVFDAGPAILIVTAGAAGATAYRRDHSPFRQPAFQVDAVDSLGAGDAFTTGFVTGLLERRPFAEAMRRAAAAGALVTRRIGVFDVLPTRDELERFLAERPDEAHGSDI